MTDKEADYHKTANGFIIGYNAHLGVDAKHGMIVTQNVVTEKSDSEHTVSLVEDVEAKRCKTGTETEEATKYILDAGYSSENNLAALKDKDVYMPDREPAPKQALCATQDVLPFCRFARHFRNGKMKAILSSA